MFAGFRVLPGGSGRGGHPSGKVCVAESGNWPEGRSEGAVGEKEEDRHLSAHFLEDLLTGDPKVHRKGVMIANAVIAEPLDLEMARVSNSVELAYCQFQKQVVCRGAIFDKNLTMSGSNFWGPTDFQRIEVGKSFAADRAEFSDESQGASFNGMRVGTTFNIESAIFKGPVNFSRAVIGEEFFGNKTQYLKRALFQGMKVERSFIIRESTFNENADFSLSTFGEAFWGEEAQFRDMSIAATFIGVRVGGSTSLRRARFYGTVKFSRMEIKNNLRADEVMFFSDWNSFDNIKVENIASFGDIVINKSINFEGSNFGDLIIHGKKLDGKKEQKDVNLEMVSVFVQRELKIEDLNITNLQMTNCKINGPVVFKNLKISEKADLHDSSLSSLNIDNVTWPASDDKINIDGLTYQSISPICLNEIKNLISRSKFNANNFIQLENYFQQIGKKDIADDIYIEMKSRQLSELDWWNPVRWGTLIFWGLPTGYGRKSYRVIYLSFLMIITGAFLLDPLYLEGEHPYSNIQSNFILRFLLSIDMFLPKLPNKVRDVLNVPDLNFGLAQAWNSPKNRFHFYYSIFHKLCGLIIIVSFFPTVIKGILS